MSSELANPPRARHLEEKTACRIALIAVPAAVGVGATGVGALVVLAWLVAGSAALLILVYVRSPARLLVSGAVGGGGAGLVALGGGSRVAMRIVSLAGAPTEMTFEGTAFLLILGAVVGGGAGVTIALMARAWPGSTSIAGWVVSSALYVALFADSRAFDELVHAGLGGWVNFPLFAVPVVAYGLLTVRVIAGAAGDGGSAFLTAAAGTD